MKVEIIKLCRALDECGEEMNTNMKGEFRNLMLSGAKKCLMMVVGLGRR